MSSTRWDPWSDVATLREAMASMLEREQGNEPLSTAGSLGLAVDVYESETAYLVIASVPGVKPEEVGITVLGDTVRITGERSDPPLEEPGGRWLRRERSFGAFDRTLRMPAEIDADAASASFDAGVLTIRLPKAQRIQPRSIKVRPTGKAASGS
jgi:HSP20 family protein